MVEKWWQIFCSDHKIRCYSDRSKWNTRKTISVPQCREYFMFYLSNISSAVVVLPLLPCYVIDDFSHKEGIHFVRQPQTRKLQKLVTPKVTFYNFSKQKCYLFTWVFEVRILKSKLLIWGLIWYIFQTIVNKQLYNAEKLILSRQYLFGIKFRRFKVWEI